MAAPPNSLRLERSVPGRLLGGARFQPLIAFLAALLVVRAIALAIDAIDDRSLPLGATLLVLAAAVAVVVVGATGAAAADDAGVRWRYYLSHRIAWADVQSITLEVRGTSIVGVRHLIVIRSGGRRHIVTPANQAGPGRVGFGRELLAAAAARGIVVEDQWA